jgi:hypothetical protein
MVWRGKHSGIFGIFFSADWHDFLNVQVWEIVWFMFIFHMEKLHGKFGQVDRKLRELNRRKKCHLSDKYIGAKGLATPHSQLRYAFPTTSLRHAVLFLTNNLATPRSQLCSALPTTKLCLDHNCAAPLSRSHLCCAFLTTWLRHAHNCAAPSPQLSYTSLTTVLRLTNN